MTKQSDYGRDVWNELIDEGIYLLLGAYLCAGGALALMISPYVFGSVWATCISEWGQVLGWCLGWIPASLAGIGSLLAIALAWPFLPILEYVFGWPVLVYPSDYCRWIHVACRINDGGIRQWVDLHIGGGLLDIIAEQPKPSTEDTILRYNPDTGLFE